MSLINKNKPPLLVEPLSVKHLWMKSLLDHQRQSTWLQVMLLKCSFSRLAKPFAGLFTIRQPDCLVAVEENTIIAKLVTKPVNKKGTCYSITFDDEAGLLSPPVNNPLVVDEQDINNLLFVSKSPKFSVFPRVAIVRYCIFVM